MLKAIINSEWWEGIVWLLWTSVGGLFPVWAGLAALQLMGKNPTLSDFSSNGQFALYAASFITASSYIVFKEYKTKSVFFRRMFGAACLACVIVICFLFIITTAGQANMIFIEKEKLSLLRKLSYILYGISAIIAFLLTVLDKKRTAKDLLHIEQSNIKKLEEEVKAIGD
jgi:preprotein translocase subunit SecG